MNMMTSPTNVISDAAMARDFLADAGEFLPPTDTQRGIVQLRNGVPVGCVLYDQNNGSNVFAHCAGTPGKPWMTRQMLYAMFHYPFVQHNLRRVTLWISSSNGASIRFAEHLGFEFEAALPQAGADGQPIFIYRMLRKDCRYV